MNTHFPIPTGKPFRGITTIQLFDKNGKMIEEVVHENTYNQRIQFRNYLDTILHCKPVDVSKNIPYALTARDEVQYGTYNDNMDYRSFWSTSSSISINVRQPFATLWLTNATANEAANGYPNGIPVALADSSGVASNIATVLCAGQPNVQESYFGNDRLHLVFDFDTVHGNITFDSLWLYPSNYCRGSGGGGACYYVLPFFQKQLVKRENDTSFIIPVQFPYVYQEPLNGPYSLLWFTVSSSSNISSRASVRQVIVFNMQTGEILANCTFTNNTEIYGSFYYDAGSNNLYMVYNTNDQGDAPFSDSSSSSFRLYKVNLTTGVRSLVADMKTMLNMVKSNYNYGGNINNWRYNVDLYWLAGENTVVMAVPTEGTDASTGQQSGYYTWYTFNALTESFDFVKRQRVYSGPCCSSSSIYPNYSSQSFVRDGKLYLACLISPNAQTHNSYAVFNIKTGALLYDKALSYSSSSVYSPVTLNSMYFYSSSTYGRAQRDDLIYRNITRSLSENSPSTASLRIDRYDTALWSTHNKLTSAITKTDQTTMKIQYDIIWDSLNDVIIPGLM